MLIEKLILNTYASLGDELNVCILVDSISCSSSLQGISIEGNHNRASGIAKRRPALSLLAAPSKVETPAVVETAATEEEDCTSREEDGVWVTYEPEAPGVV